MAKVLKFGVAALLCATAPASKAGVLTFTLSGTDNAQFQLASDAAYTSGQTNGGNYAQFDSVAGIFPGGFTVASLDVYDAAAGGGFQLTFSDRSYISDLGSIIFQGSTGNLTFLPGSFSFTQSFDAGPISDQLIIRDGSVQPSVPEPSTWATLVSGFFLIGSVVRGRRHLVSFGALNMREHA